MNDGDLLRHTQLLKTAPLVVNRCRPLLVINWLPLLHYGDVRAELFDRIKLLFDEISAGALVHRHKSKTLHVVSATVDCDS